MAPCFLSMHRMDVLQTSLNDRHINTLVERCKKISVLDLKSTSITYHSITSIIENLQPILEELNVRNTYVRNVSLLINKKSFPKLISLNDNIVSLHLQDKCKVS